MLRSALIAGLVVTFLLSLNASSVPACCPVAMVGKPVVNADQTVIIIWDAAAKTQHFIRKASFTSDAEDFGFLIPSPSLPELAEAGDDAFPYLGQVTEPEVKWRPRPIETPFGCAAPASLEGSRPAAAPALVKVVAEKEVAGFQAAVLEAESAQALVNWLKENGYNYSPEVEEWAKPYVQLGWNITALKVARKGEGTRQQNVVAPALRMSFHTERPLFPYREPDSTQDARNLGTKDRLLRIFFVGEARYKGELTADKSWSGKVAWTNPISAAARKKALELLKLPPSTGPATWWLTEFEDHWPYAVAPADVYFARDRDQSRLKREPYIRYVSNSWPNDGSICALAAIVVLPPLWRWRRRQRRPK